MKTYNTNTKRQYAKIISKSSISPIPEKILRKYPYLKHSKYSVESLVRALIWSRSFHYSCFRLAIEVDKDVNVAFPLKCWSLKHVVDEETEEIKAIKTTPDYKLLEGFKKLLKDLEGENV